MIRLNSIFSHLNIKNSKKIESLIFMYEQHHFVNGGITNAPFLHKKLRLIEKLNFWTFFEIKLISSEKRHVRVKLFSQKTQRITQCFLHSCRK